MISRRQNFLKTLRKEPHDYMPASFVIDNMNYPGSFPESVFDVTRCFDIEHSLQFQRRLGLDALFRLSPNGVKETAVGHLWQADPAGGRICETPVGTLHSDAPAAPGAPMLELGREVILKKPEDYDTLAWLFENQRYEIDGAGSNGRTGSLNTSNLWLNENLGLPKLVETPIW